MCCMSPDKKQRKMAGAGKLISRQRDADYTGEEDKLVSKLKMQFECEEIPRKTNTVLVLYKKEGYDDKIMGMTEVASDCQRPKWTEVLTVDFNSEK